MQRCYSSPSIFPSVGRCLFVFSFFFGAARVTGTAPITLRERAFTAVTARNGFFFFAATMGQACQKRPENSKAIPDTTPISITDANSFADVFQDRVFPKISAEDTLKTPRVHNKVTT